MFSSEISFSVSRIIWRSAGAFLPLIMIAFSLSSCSSGEQAPAEYNLREITLSEDLFISIQSIESDVLAGDFSGLAVDKDGKIFAADSRQQSVHVFSAGGRYLHSLGGKGQGPGEFENFDSGIRVVSDTLYIKQNNPGKIELFNTVTQEHIRSINIPRQDLRGVPMGSPRDFIPLSNGEILISFVNPYFSKPNEGDPPNMVTFSLLNKSGEFTDKEILQIPALYPTDQRLVHMKTDAIHVFSSVSFYPDIFVLMDSHEQIYISNSDRLEVTRYDPEGIPADTLKWNLTPAPFAETDLDSLSAEIPGLKEAAEDAGYPDFWPAYQHILFDDGNNFWIQQINSGASHQPWLVSDGNENLEFSFLLPSAVHLSVVQNGKAYGIFRSEDELPAIVRYELPEL